ncbi:MAG: hypothetical protein JWM76_4983 [Pseudonocardiales bacterium]|nr:hypothetical protein [Pseudonocardiales bacterium]
MSSSRSLRSGRLAFAGILAVALAATAACSSSTKSASSGTSGSAGASGSVLGAANAASGTPITLGFITDGKSAAIDFSSQEQTAQAAVKYINEHLGGVAGHPIALKVCETQQTPARAIDCANQMVTAGVPVVLNPLTGVGPSLVPIIAAAGIPYVTFAGTTAAELTTPNVFSLTGSIASFLGGIAEYSKEQGFKRVAVMGMNIPAVIQSLNTLGKLVFTKAGVDMQIVPVSPGSADLTPQIQTVIDGKADAMLVFGDATICAGALKAASALNYTGKRMVVAQCVKSSISSTIPGGWAGVTISATANLQAGDKEYELYKAVLKQYSPDTAKANSVDTGAINGYGAVLGFARSMSAMTTGDLTSKAISTTISAAKDSILPVGGGLKFTCDGTAVAGLSAICSVGAQITTLTKDGAATTYTPVDASSLFK